VESGVPFGGSPADWIVEDSEVRHVDLVIMATHDREGPDRWLHGSIAESVVHRSTIPVLLVRPIDSIPLAARLAAEQPVLIVPLDGSQLAEAALPFARELGQALAARIMLVGVVPRPGQLIAGQGGTIVTYTGPEHAQLEAGARAYLTATAEGLEAAGASTEILVRYGDAALEVGAVAEAYEAAAVVMATHGRTGIVRAMLGSVAGGVLHHTTTPVVLIRPGKPSAAAEPVAQHTASSSGG
jgi:nucleotide-binding universal stress UspA family protein